MLPCPSNWRIIRGVSEVDTPRLHFRRAFSVGFCLLAVLLLQAPMPLAAWALSTGMCCTSGFCPIASHHHHQATEQPSHEMNCGHDMSGMTACTMSCCHDSDGPAIACVVFLMPPVASFSVPLATHPATAILKQADFLRSIEPLSPPPRLPFSIS